MGHDERAFERIGSDLIHEGRILTLTNDHFRYADGKVADTWTPLKMYYSSVGFATEAVHLFLAEGLRDAEGEHDSGEDERIEIVRWPLDDLDGALAATSDSKTVIGLLLLERRRRSA